MSENSPNHRLKVDSWVASSLLQKAIRRPSGDQRGLACPLSVVRRCSVEPLLTKTSPFRTNATRLGSPAVPVAVAVAVAVPVAVPGAVRVAVPLVGAGPPGAASTSVARTIEPPRPIAAASVTLPAI